MSWAVCPRDLGGKDENEVIELWCAVVVVEFGFYLVGERELLILSRDVDCTCSSGTVEKSIILWEILHRRKICRDPDCTVAEEGQVLWC